jgi:hypothetical protein
VELWRITSEAPGWLAEWPGWDVDFVWSWPIERQGQVRTVSVGVARGAAEAGDVAADSRHALESRGRSAVVAVLDRDEPPRRITIASAGLRDERD